MIKNYLKTSGRSVVRNKLFSIINIAGLAISMSVGLLLIAFLVDLSTYDRFHKNGDRIFRITNTLHSKREHGGKFATTSAKTGRLIRDKVSGVEAVTVMRNNFSGDAKTGEHILPIKGYWAEPSFFRIFTFPLIEGNMETALRDPYAIILTESAAEKLFCNRFALGRTVQIDTLQYQVTGVLKDIPFFSHIHFDALVSLSTTEHLPGDERHAGTWTNMWSHSVYLLPTEKTDAEDIQKQLDQVAREENVAESENKIQLQLLPLYDIVVGERLQQSEGGPGFVGPHVPIISLWILGALAWIVILSACFNYTNLSMARAMKRFKEIGLRKAIGAGNTQVRQQFLAEAVIISLLSLFLSFFLFLLLKPQLLHLAPEIQRTVRLDLKPPMLMMFVIFAVAVGIFAGFMPALFFSKINPIQVFGHVSSFKFFKNLTLRRSLIFVQYIVTLIFITATTIGYVQYKNILAFDLGFETDNILNINMLDNDPEPFLKDLGELPEVTAMSRSLITTGVGNAWGGNLKYKDTRDSALAMTNHVDHNYLPLHNYTLLAGGNFITRPVSKDAVAEVIVNEQVLKRFNIGNNNPEKAIGEQILLNGRKLTIVGVMQDFHYGKVDNLIGPVAFTYWTSGERAIVSVKINTTDIPATMSKIEAIWKKVDPVHTFTAEFYDDAIRDAYSEFSMMIKIIGFLSFLAISIASMGLFGMVVFTTETRLKEIGIRKIMGASTPSLIYLLGRGFLFLLSLAALIALPLTYIFFEKVILVRFPYHSPVQISELFAGALGVLAIACAMIGSQVLKAARNNPVTVLKND